MSPTRFLCAALTLVPCILPSVTAHAAPVTADASVAFYRNDAGHTGYTAAPLATPLSLIWRHTTDPSSGSSASPICANGVVYFAGATHVYAVRAADGATLWQYPAASDTTGKFRSTPTLSGGALYIGDESGNLDKIDAKTGQLLWAQKVGGAIQGAPAVENGVIYFGSADYHCYAVSDDATHNILWSFLTNGAVSASPILGDQDVYFASTDENVYSLAKSNGSKQWSIEYNYDPSTAPPAYADGTLFVAAGPTLYAVNGRSGQTKWSQRISGGITSAPTVGPDFVGVSAQDGTVSAFSRQGRLQWRDSLGEPSYGAPLLTSNLYLVPDQHGVLYALQADSGKLAWEYVVPASVTRKEAPPVTAGVTSAPLLADGTLYVLSDDGSLSAFRPDGLSSLPPQVTAMDPTPGSTVAGDSVLPRGTVAADETGINPSTVSLSLDGKTLQNVIFDADKSQVTLDTSSPDSSGLGKLDDGAHEMVLKATDWHGNTVTQSWGFFVDNGLDSQNNNGNQ